MSADDKKSMKNYPVCKELNTVKMMWSAAAQLRVRLGIEGLLAGSQCVVSLSKILYPLLSTGSTQEDRKLS